MSAWPLALCVAAFAAAMAAVLAVSLPGAIFALVLLGAAGVAEWWTSRRFARRWSLK